MSVILLLAVNIILLAQNVDGTGNMKAGGMCASLNPGNWLDPSYWWGFWGNFWNNFKPHNYGGLPTGAAIPLPELDIDSDKVTVAGLSSGAYMSVQLHVAYSSVFRGAGVVAGGPYYCAQGNIMNSLYRCMCHILTISVGILVDTTRQWALDGLIDSVDNLRGSKVYIFSGKDDTTVSASIGYDLRDYYSNFGTSTKLQNTLLAEHAYVTADKGNGCRISAMPFVNNCGHDMVGEMLSHLYGPLNAPTTPNGRLIKFDQSQFVAPGKGMSPVGYAYIPKACEGGATTCKLHVALHGCAQNADKVGGAFVTWPPTNSYAESNNIVVLYPQTGADASGACWDWFGYTGTNYARKGAAQIEAIKNMVFHISQR